MKTMILSILFVLLIHSCHLNALETSEDANYTYTKHTWAEIAASDQRLLMQYFDQKLTNLLEEWGISSFWNTQIEQIFLGHQDRYNSIMASAKSLSSKFAESNNVIFQDLIPTGFIVGFGLNYDGEVLVGLGGSALLTFIVVPLEVQRVDKTTGATTSYFEVSWGIGGFAQQGIGVGGGADINAHGAIGLIWGPLPDATVLQGPAAGISANIAKVAGLGFKAAFVFNSITKQNNLVALVTYNVGAAESAAVTASAFYFISAEQIIKTFNIDSSWITNGVETIATALLRKATQ